MDRSERKLRTCLFFVIIAAVLTGCIYYFFEFKDPQEIEKGVLITGNGIRMIKIWEQ